jgi:hypothetical protein
MKKFRILTALLAVGALLSWADASDATPLVGFGNSAWSSQLDQGFVQQVHRWHCQRRKGWYRGKMRWHQHSQACRDYGYVHPYPSPYYGYAPLPYYGYYDWRRERRNWLWD